MYEDVENFNKTIPSQNSRKRNLGLKSKGEFDTVKNLLVFLFHSLFFPIFLQIRMLTARVTTQR